MWREKLTALHGDFTFAKPATSASISEAEHDLAIELPKELRELLLESDGVRGDYGLGLIWPVVRIRADNLARRTEPSFRELYMPFDSLLFFADAGNGDLFAYPITAGRVRRREIFCWDHEDDSRKWVAPSLGEYFEWWPDGRLKI